MVKHGDTVVFRHVQSGGSVTYEVTTDHLRGRGGDNSRIFRLLGMTETEKYDLAIECYGYAATDGDWPEYKVGDYEAAQRIIDRLHVLCGAEPVIVGEKDRVKFTHAASGKVVEYSVTIDHLSNVVGIDNGRIFDILGMDDFEKRRFVTECYEYSPGPGIWPEFYSNDYAAAQRLIDKLHKLCAGKKEGMDKSCITKGETVEFTIAGTGKTFTYKVGPSHLSCPDINSAIFRELGIDHDQKRVLASECYGYQASTGDWPSYRTGDFAAAQRLVDELHGLCRRAGKKIEAGEYVWTSDGRFASRNKVMVCDRVEGEKVYFKKEGGVSAWWDRAVTRPATEREILASEYADAYKQSLLTFNPITHYEVQSKITTIRSREGHQEIKPRRRAVKTTSAGRLVGNQIKVVSRRGKIGGPKVSGALLTIKRG